VCERERGKEREGKREGKRGRKNENVFVHSDIPESEQQTYAHISGKEKKDEGLIDAKEEEEKSLDVGEPNKH